MINASQRVIFDPAGSFKADVVPEYNDVLYGITPAVFEAYRGSHARETFHVVTQEVTLTAAQAERAFQLATSNGRVPGAYCANATSGIMAQIPGFEAIDRTFFPVPASGTVRGNARRGDPALLRERQRRPASRHRRQ